MIESKYITFEAPRKSENVIASSKISSVNDAVTLVVLSLCSICCGVDVYWALRNSPFTLFCIRCWNFWRFYWRVLALNLFYWDGGWYCKTRRWLSLYDPDRLRCRVWLEGLCRCTLVQHANLSLETVAWLCIIFRRAVIRTVILVGHGFPICCICMSWVVSC